MSYVQLEGYYAAGDKAPVIYRWNAASAANDDGGSVINPSGNTGPGRWLLSWNQQDAYVLDWGVKIDGSDQTTPLQNCINSFPPGAHGTVHLPIGGISMTGIVLGANNGADGVSYISIKGLSQEASRLQYVGLANGVAIKFNTNQFSRFEDFCLVNISGGRGTTQGIQFGGSAFGTQDEYNTFSKLVFDGFHVGWHPSINDPDNPATAASTCGSECTLVDCLFQNCDVGILQDDYNSLNHTCINCGFEFCTLGALLRLPGINFLSGSGDYNGIDIYFSDGTNFQGDSLYIANWRSENACAFLSTRGPTILEGISVANLRAQSAVDYGVSHIEDIPVNNSTLYTNYALHSIWAMGGANISIKNCMFINPVFIRTPIDISIEQSIMSVGGGTADLIEGMLNNPAAVGSRYHISNCKTTGDLAYSSNLINYPDRQGTLIEKPSSTGQWAVLSDSVGPSGSTLFPQTSAPTAPPAVGAVTLYVDSNGDLHALHADGVDHTLSVH